jgi:hypothetical protein
MLNASPSGTGKSHLLKSIISTLKESYSILPSASDDSLAVTASTGIASVNIDGCTLHSWGGIGLGSEPAEKIADKLRYQKKCRQALNRWQRVKTLILDESEHCLVQKWRIYMI